MGFYLRKSIRVGPFRFNLSKSGVGISAGIKGLRFGSGPRGNYIHMGRGGFYYRVSIPSSSTETCSRPKWNPPNTLHLSPTHTPLEEIESADISMMVDSSSEGLLQELNQKHKKMQLWPIAGVVFFLLLLLGILAGWPTFPILAILVLGLLGTWCTVWYDSFGKTVVLFYEFDPEMENAYTKLHHAISQMAGCAGIWHIGSRGNVLKRKYHAGADSIVSRKETFIKKSEPPHVKSNVETYAIGVGRQTLYFFPDRLLVYDQNGVGAVSYRDLCINSESKQFIEEENVPQDTKVVNRTWRYVNKSGGPDRRFKNNREIPVCLYNEVSFSSQTGLNEVLHLSRSDVSENLVAVITDLSSVISLQKNVPSGVQTVPRICESVFNDEWQ